MVGKDFEVGDLVWAQMKNYPPWPSKIAQPSTSVKSPNAKKSQHFVYFFGSKNYAWIPDEKIFPHGVDMMEKTVKKKSATFLKAVEEILLESKKNPKEKIEQRESVNSFQMSENDNVEETKFQESKTTTPQKKDSPEKTKKKISRKRSIEMNGDDPGSTPKVRKLNFSMASSSSVQNYFAPILPESNENFPSLPSSILQRGEYIERPPTPPLDIKEVKKSLLDKDVKPTGKKIGFLGLGTLGRGIVKNLLNSGHDVTVWNRTPTKCDAFIEAGAHKGQTPADVIQSCDITFCCVSEPMATKTLVFGNCGVLKGLEGCTPGSKGYVELTGIDPETSQEIAKEICNKGGRYMEAPITGSRSLAEEGQLLVLAAGDHELFSACKSCFLALAKHAYFVSLDVGNACRMSLILSMFKGSVMGALAEALTMIDRCKLPPDNFLEILNAGSASSPMLRDKGQAMKKRNFVTDIALKHQQKDLTLALTLANSLNQPLLITAAANETFKHAKLLRYSDHDVSAVIQGTLY